MERNNFDTLDEAIEDIDGGEYSGPQDLVLLPPANDPYASDEEEGDDDIGLAGNINLPSDVTGAVEIHRDNEESDDDESSNEGNEQSKRKRNKRKWRDGVQLFDVNWYKNNDISYVIEDFGELIDNTELQLYKLSFDKEVEQLFIDKTTKYATAQENDANFSLNRAELWDFFTIITFSPYNTRPQFCYYWSNEADLSCSFVRELMSRNHFTKIKLYLHVCNNENLNLEDKWAKLRPLIQIVNDKLIQFGIFAEY